MLAGRSEERLAELAERLGGLEIGAPTRCARTPCSPLVEPGDVLVSTVGPFAKWGEPAVRAAIAAGATYLDSTGEPAFIRRVFDEFGPRGRARGAALLTAMGYDFVPGALAGALALARPASERRARRRRLLLARRPAPTSLSAGTRAVARRRALADSLAFRDGAARTVRSAERVR